MTCNTHSTLSMAEISSLNASVQQMTREELRLWDASARAWLQTADSAMRKEHVQLKLIIQNINIPVMTGATLYASVIKAWTQALVGTEKLIAGEPQSVTNGAILLAISAWHLYPDLFVFSPKTTSVTFSDPLMDHAGVLTVGITNAASSPTGKDGIHWSVALSHYRHYGHPTRAVGELDDRLTIDELYLVTLGGLLKLWGEPRANFEPAAEWFVALWNCVHMTKTGLAGPAWMKPLAKAASRFLNSTNQERKELLALLDFGFRRGAYFLVPKPRRRLASLPWFGLRTPHITSSLGQSDSQGCAVEYLRQTAAICKLDPYKTLITSTNRENQSEHLVCYTAIPIGGGGIDDLGGSSQGSQSTSKGKERAKDLKPPKHRIWRDVPLMETGNSTNISFPVGPADDHHQDRFNVMPLKKFLAKSVSDPIGDTRVAFEAGLAKRLFVSPYYKFAEKEAMTNCHVAVSALECYSTSTVSFAGLIGEETKRFGLWVGKDDVGSPRVAKKLQDLHEGKAEPLMDFKSSIRFFESGINCHLVWQYLEGVDPYDLSGAIKPVLSLMRWERGHFQGTIDSLRSLAAAYEVYKSLEGATISSAIVSRGIHDAEWALMRPGDRLTQPMMFSCIAMMETGTINLHADKFNNVLALASGNSIYILRHFVTDPALRLPSPAIVRIVGNVGRVGISLLIPPAYAPLIRPLSDSLRAVEYATFDGKRENNFTSTSLHLSFTPHEFPLDYGASGVIDHQVFYVESVVSVHDSGQWVADLDILGIFRDGARKILKFSKGNRSKRPHGH